MPIYSYLCECGHEFESVQKMDTKQADCPKCGKPAKKTVSRVAPFRWGSGGIMALKRAKTQAQLDHATDLRLRKAYGITLAEYNTRNAANGGRCEICRKPPVKVRLSVDHDHAWKKVKIEARKFQGAWIVEARYCGKRHTAAAEKKSIAVKNVKRLLLQTSVRGLLCIHCNRGLRFYSDLPERMHSAAAYLERHQREGTDANTKS